MSNKKSSKGFGKKIIIGCIILAVISLIGAYFLKPKTSTDKEIKANKSDITTYYSFTGNVEAKNKQVVYADKALQINELKVSKGQKVTKDTVLLTTTAGAEIKATIDGEVSDIKAEKNQQVMPGTEIMSIVDYDNLQLSVKIDEYDLAAATVGKEAKIAIHSLEKDINGKIEDVSREGTDLNGVTYFTALISLDKDNSLRVGMSAEAKILNKSVKQVLNLPMAAIQFEDNNKPYVYIKKSKSSVKKDLVLGITDGVKVEIKDGINDNDTILVPQKQSSGFSPGSMRNNSNGNKQSQNSSGNGGTGGNVNNSGNSTSSANGGN